MKILLCILYLLMLTFQLKAIYNYFPDDVLIFENDTLYLYNSLPIDDDLFSKINKYTTIEDYYVEWRIINNILFLSNVYDSYSNNNLNSIVEQILGKKFSKGLMKADWFDGDFWAGKNIHKENSNYYPLIYFKNEYYFDFNKGCLKKTKKVNYIPCEFFDKENLNEFITKQLYLTKHYYSLEKASDNLSAYPIYDSIGKIVSVKVIVHSYDSMYYDLAKNELIERITDLENTSVRITAYLESNQRGKIKDVIITKSSNSYYNDIIKYALLKIPCMPVFPLKGSCKESTRYVDLYIEGESIKKHAH